MRRFSQSRLLAIALLGALGLLFNTAEAGAPSSTFTGYILVRVKTQPIAGAKVEVRHKGAIFFTGITGSDGKVTIPRMKYQDVYDCFAKKGNASGSKRWKRPTDHSSSTQDIVLIR